VERASGSHRQDLAHPVHVTGDQVPAEARAQRQCPLQVHPIADAQIAQRGHAQTLAADIGGKLVTVERGDGQADAVDGDGIAQLRVREVHARRTHLQAEVATARFHRGDGTQCLDDSGEHPADHLFMFILSGKTCKH